MSSKAGQVLQSRVLCLIYQCPFYSICSLQSVKVYQDQGSCLFVMFLCLPILSTTHGQIDNSELQEGASTLEVDVKRFRRSLSSKEQGSTRVKDIKNTCSSAKVTLLFEEQKLRSCSVSGKGGGTPWFIRRFATCGEF